MANRHSPPLPGAGCLHERLLNDPNAQPLHGHCDPFTPQIGHNRPLLVLFPAKKDTKALFPALIRDFLTVFCCGLSALAALTSLYFALN
jgi:hypothetical protein